MKVKHSWLCFLSFGCFQIPCEDRCLDPQIPPEKAFRGSKHLISHKVFGGFWKTSFVFSF